MYNGKTIKILFPYMARWKAVNWSRYHSLFNELAEMGHEIYVLQPPRMKSDETNFQDIEVEIPSNIHLIDVRVPEFIWKLKLPLNKLFKKGLYSLWCLKIAKKTVAEKSIDCLVLYNIPQYFLGRIKGCKIVFDLCDDYIDMLEKELGRFSNVFTVGFAKSIILNSMLKNADYVFSVSNVLRDAYFKKAIILPNGVSGAKAENARRNPLKLSLPKPIVGFIGSFEYFIDFEIMLDAASRLPDVTFLLVGFGRLWKQVKEEINRRNLSNVHLTGSVSHIDVFKYIDGMDICLSIFKKMKVSHAACPMKLFEYMIMEKPVISTRLDELVRIGLENLIYADTADELVSSINELLKNKGLRSSLGKMGKERVYKEFTWQRIANQFLDTVSDPPDDYVRNLTCLTAVNELDKTGANVNCHTRETEEDLHLKSAAST